MPSRAQVVSLITSAEVRDRFPTTFSNQMAPVIWKSAHRVCVNNKYNSGKLSQVTLFFFFLNYGFLPFPENQWQCSVIQWQYFQKQLQYSLNLPRLLILSRAYEPVCLTWPLPTFQLYPVLAFLGIPGDASGKRTCLPMQEKEVRSLGWEDPLEQEMAPHSSILARRIPWTEEPGRLLFIGWQRVGHY